MLESSRRRRRPFLTLATAAAVAASLPALAIAAPQPTSGAAAPPARPTPQPPTEPIRVGDRLIYPEGALIPRGLTPTERQFLEEFPLSTGEAGLRGPGATPDGPVFCPPEYAPVEGFLVAWEQFMPLLTQMIQRVTSTANGTVYVVVDTAAEQTTATSTLAAATNPAVDMSRVKFVIRPTDTVWIRDYGPRYIYQGTPGHQCRSIVDHVYNRPRPNDDVFPSFFSTTMGHKMYSLPLVHGGGNYHLDGLGRSYATRLISNENPGLTDPVIIGRWHDYQNVNTTLLTPFPTSVDSTQHLDMWMQIIDDNRVIISDWPNNSGSTQDVICDNQAVAMAAAGYTVYRVPAYSIGGVHFTFCNMVMCNGIVLLPMYSSVPAGANAAALATVQGALPGKSVVQINCDSIVPSAGVMHCIVMHVPRHLGAPGVGGLAPTTYLRTLRGGGPALQPGASASIAWLADDDIDATTADLFLSVDGGATFPITIAQDLPIAADGATGFSWTVPNRFVRTGRIKVLVRDSHGNTAFDQSESDIRIAGTCTADWDGSGAVQPADVAAYINTWFADLGAGTAEAEFDGVPGVTPADVAAFVTAWFSGLGGATGC